MTYKFTPRIFIDALSLNGVKLSWLVKKHGLSREYFIPRYNEKILRGVKSLPYNYQKRLNDKTIEKIADILDKSKFFTTKKEDIILCFKNNNFDALLPEDLL